MSHYGLWLASSPSPTWARAAPNWRRRGSGLADNPNFGYVNDFSDGAIKAIGGVEVLVRSASSCRGSPGIAPVLTPIAAVGLAVLQVERWSCTAAVANSSHGR